MDIVSFLVHLLLATAVGVIIGIEREWRLRSAGLLTNTLVAIGAAVYVMAGTTLTTNTTGDPSRVLGQIVAGVGFLGAGVIMRDGFNIHGLNSAATIWCSAAVGSLVGLDLYAAAFIAAGIIVSSNLCIRWLADWINKLAMKKQDVYNSVMFHFFLNENHEKLFRQHLMETLAKYPNITLKSFYAKENISRSSERELVCEVNCPKKLNSDLQKFKEIIFSHPDLIKIKQDNEIKMV